MVGLEALVRWQHPTKGLVFPGAFIPLLERTGLIANLDLLVWEEACRQTREWLDAGIPTLPISVNISRADLQFVDVANSLESFIKKYNIDRSFLELEITESAFVEDDAVIDAVIDLKERGFTLLMDDFGSGYSSLNMLKNIPVDILKIDMRFLELSENVLSRGESILDAVVSMAHTMGLSVIAEGAETEEQVEFLKSINCDFVQGYYFYRPLPVESLEALLGQENIIDYLGANRKQVELLSPVDLIQNYVTNKTILDSILGGIAIYGVSPDGDLELIQANNRYFQLVGDNPPKDEEDRLDFFRRAPKEVIEETVGLLRESEKHPVLGAEDEFCQRRADGLFIWVKVKAFFLTKEGDRSIYFGRLTDISVQKDQEDVLRASEDALTEALGLLPAHGEKSAADDKNVREALAAFVRNLPGALLGLANRDNYPVLFSNNEVAFILGYVSYRDFMEHTMAGFRSLIHPNDLEQFDNYLISEQHNSTRALLKLRLKRKSGTFVSIYAQCRVINRDDGRSLLMLNLINIEKVGSTTIVNLQDS
ncbi:MAG: EAL domain-containing protein [Raoultibacter sp.]|jgi:EAL domain-containing protein (putative c-di-GMP-specific phosphodiesterase class I)